MIRGHQSLLLRLFSTSKKTHKKNSIVQERLLILIKSLQLNVMQLKKIKRIVRVKEEERI